MFGRPHISENAVTGRQIRLPLVYVVAGVNGKKTVRIPWHSHAYFELLFVLEGGTAYEIADRRRLDLVGGQFFVVPPGVPHRGIQNLRTPSNVCGIAFDPGAREARKNTPFTTSELKWLGRQVEQHSLSVRPMGNPFLSRSPAIRTILAQRPARRSPICISWRTGSPATFRGLKYCP